MPAPPPDPDDHRDLRWRRAHLVTGSVLTWPDPLPTDATARLHVALDGGLRVDGPDRAGGERGVGLARADGGRIAGADVEVVLRPDPAGLPSSLTDRDGFRHLAGRTALHLGGGDGSLMGDGGPIGDGLFDPGIPGATHEPVVPDRWLAGQLAVSIHDRSGRLLAASGVQTALAIDERFATDEALGPRWHEDGTVEVAVWAPTARRVALRLTYEPERGDAARWEPIEAVRGTSGVWTVPIPEDHLGAGDVPTNGRNRASKTGVAANITGAGYRFEVEVYDPLEDAVVTNVVTDPWSVGLSADARWSLLLDLDDL